MDPAAIKKLLKAMNQEEEAPLKLAKQDSSQANDSHYDSESRQSSKQFSTFKGPSDPEERKKAKQQQSLKMGEVDWFAYQNNLRKIIIELVEPTVKRSLASEGEIAFIKEENYNLRKKIDELEFVF